MWLDDAPVKETSGQQARTNFRASRISPGHHVLEIRGENRFKPWRQDVEIEPGAIRKIHALLIPAVGGPGRRQARAARGLAARGARPRGGDGDVARPRPCSPPTPPPSAVEPPAPRKPPAAAPPFPAAHRRARDRHHGRSRRRAPRWLRPGRDRQAAQGARGARRRRGASPARRRPRRARRRSRRTNPAAAIARSRSTRFRGPRSGSTARTRPNTRRSSTTSSPAANTSWRSSGPTCRSTRPRASTSARAELQTAVHVGHRGLIEPTHGGPVKTNPKSSAERERRRAANRAIAVGGAGSRLA